MPCAISTAPSPRSYTVTLNNLDVVEGDSKATTASRAIRRSMKGTTSSTASTRRRSSFQRLLLTMCKRFELERYRKCGDSCFVQVVSPEGHDTHAFTYASTIEEEIFRLKKEVHFAAWKVLTNPRDNANAVIKHLIQSDEIEFPKLGGRRRLVCVRRRPLQHQVRPGVPPRRGGHVGRLRGGDVGRAQDRRTVSVPDQRDGGRQLLRHPLSARCTPTTPPRRSTSTRWTLARRPWRRSSTARATRTG